jgi:ribosome-binding factor A
MTREFSRTNRVASQIQRELAVLICEELKDPRLGMITVQEVRVARDLSHAKVYVTVIGGDLDEAGNVKRLNGAAGFLRSMLARRVKLRTVPELHFVFDESIERGTRLASLIEEAVGKDATKH